MRRVYPGCWGLSGLEVLGSGSEFPALGPSPATDGAIQDFDSGWLQQAGGWDPEHSLLQVGQGVVGAEEGQLPPALPLLPCLLGLLGGGAGPEFTFTLCFHRRCRLPVVWRWRGAACSSWSLS